MCGPPSTAARERKANNGKEEERSELWERRKNKDMLWEKQPWGQSWKEMVRHSI